MSESGLPVVGGDRLMTSLDDFEHRCLVHLREEQLRVSPDNGLIALLCDAVRLAREHVAVGCSVLGAQAEERCQHLNFTRGVCDDCREALTTPDSYARDETK